MLYVKLLLQIQESEQSLVVERIHKTPPAL